MMSAMTMPTRPSTVSSVRPSMMPLVDNDFEFSVEDMFDTFGTDQSGNALGAEMTEHYRRVMQPSGVHAQEGGTGRHASKQVTAGHGDRFDATPQSWPCPNLIPLYPPVPSQEDDNSFLNWDADIDGGITGDDALFGGTSVDSLLGDFLGDAQGMTESFYNFNDDREQILNAQPPSQSVPSEQDIGPETGKPRRQIQVCEPSTSPSGSHDLREGEGEAQVSHSGSATGSHPSQSPSALYFSDIDTPLSEGMETSPWADSLPPGNPDFLESWMDHMATPSNSLPADSDTDKDTDKALVRFSSTSSVSLIPVERDSEHDHEDCRCVDCQTSRILVSGSSETSLEANRHHKSGSESGSWDTRSSGKLITVTDGASRPVDMSARLAALVGNLVPNEPLSGRAVLQSSLSTSTTRPPPAAHKSRALAMWAGKDGRIKAGLEGSQKKLRAPRIRRLVALDGTMRPTNAMMMPPAAPCPSMDFMLARGAVGAPQRGMPAEQMGVQLVAYAEAMATDDQAKVRFLHGMLHCHADPTGLPMQKTLFYFMQALQARAEGTGSQRYNEPHKGSREEMLQGFSKCSAAMPYVPFCQEVIVTQILDVSRNTPGLHIVDINGWHAHLWCTLMSKLSKRPGGPPSVRITLILAPWLANPIKGACRSQSGNVRRELEGHARILGLEFEYEIVEVPRLESLKPNQIRRKGGEIMVASASMILNTLFDASVVRSNPRDTFLQVLRQLRPNLFLLVEQDVDTNGLFFMERFKEILRFWHTSLDSQHHTFRAANKFRGFFEREYVGRDVLNVVACEGLERTVRSERVGNWRKRMERAGFAEVTLSNNVVVGVEKMVKGYADGFSCERDGGAVKMTWQKNAMLSASGWTSMF